MPGRDGVPGAGQPWAGGARHRPRVRSVSRPAALLSHLFIAYRNEIVSRKLRSKVLTNRCGLWRIWPSPVRGSHGLHAGARDEWRYLPLLLTKLSGAVVPGVAGVPGHGRRPAACSGRARSVTVRGGPFCRPFTVGPCAEDFVDRAGVVTWPAVPTRPPRPDRARLPIRRRQPTRPAAPTPGRPQPPDPICQARPPPWTASRRRLFRTAVSQPMAARALSPARRMPGRIRLMPNRARGMPGRIRRMRRRARRMPGRIRLMPSRARRMPGRIRRRRVPGMPGRIGQMPRLTARATSTRLRLTSTRLRLTSTRLRLRPVAPARTAGLARASGPASPSGPGRASGTERASGPARAAASQPMPERTMPARMRMPPRTWSAIRPVLTAPGPRAA